MIHSSGTLLSVGPINTIGHFKYLCLPSKTLVHNECLNMNLQHQILIHLRERTEDWTEVQKKVQKVLKWEK